MGGSGGGTSAPAFSPLRLAGLNLWCRPTSSGLSDGEPVTRMSDQSGGGNPLTDQNQAAQRPTYAGGAAPSGRALIETDGVRQTLVTDKPASGIMSASSKAFAVVFRALSITHNDPAPENNDILAAPSDEWCGLFLQNADAGPLLHAVNLAGVDGTLGYVSHPIELGRLYVAYVRHSGGVLGLTINGAEESTVVSGDTHELNGSFVVGGWGGHFANCQIGDVVNCSVVPSPEDAAKLAAYLISYYGIEV